MTLSRLLVSAALSLSAAACEVGSEEELPPELEEIEAVVPVRLQNLATGECLRHQFGGLQKGGCSNQAANWDLGKLGGRFGDATAIIARDNGTSGCLAVDPATRRVFLAPSTGCRFFDWIEDGAYDAFLDPFIGGRLGISASGAIDVVVSSSDRRRWKVLPPY